jgi:hypothetical protein
MKKTLFTTAATILLMAFAASAQCPADKAAEGKKSPFSAFHTFMAPAWHTAYPAKDYDAMIKAADGMEKSFAEVAAIEPKMKNVERKAAFLNNRETFAKELKKYVEFAKAGNKDSVYAELPTLHNAFEMTAMAYSPIEFPELSAVMVTTHVIVSKHIPAKNWDGIAGSTETLVTKAESLNEKTLPEDLKSQKEPLLKEFATVQKTVADMKAAADKKDLATYQKLATLLDGKLKELSENYL